MITDGKNATAGVDSSGQPRTVDIEAVAEGARGGVGAELCGKPFRWDQRLYTLVIGGGRGTAVMASDSSHDLGTMLEALKVRRWRFFIDC